MSWLLFFCACDSLPFLSKTDTGDTGDTTLEAINKPVADIDWEEGNLVLNITNGDDIQLEFGIVETTTECAADAVYGCWTAENCDSSSGYTSPDGTPIGPYCHPVSSTGVSLEYSANLTDVMDGVTGTNVIAGMRTGFPAPTEEESYEFKVTYYLNNISSQDCWVWGVNPTYFETSNCTTPVPVHNIDGNGRTRYILE
jgi:hypothetical protein